MQGATDSPDGGRDRVLALLRRHGWNATSFQVLEPGFRYWFAGADACVAYVEAGDAWVAAGAPITSGSELTSVARRFVAAAAAAGKLACFFGVEARFEATGDLHRLRIGEQPVWDPLAWERRVRASASLREQLRRARAKGVAIQRVEPAALEPAAPLRREIDRLVAGWLSTRRMAPMGFLVGLELYTFGSERRLYTARAHGRLVGVLAAVPVYGRGGWLIEDLLRAPDAPNGTTELLVDASMRDFAAAGSTYATMGLAPLAGPVAAPLRAARSGAGLLYDFDGVRGFKARLGPERWDPIYLAYPRRTLVRSLVAALRAFAGGGLLWFALMTMLRGPPFVVRLLALLLVPWTVVLAAAGPRWFPSGAVHAGWVVFDAALFVALWSLSRRWRDRLARVLATVISADALLTAIEALAYNLPRLHGLGAALVVCVATAAPTAAAVVLWRSVALRAPAGGSR